jgi:hypothetical protein
MEGWEIDWKSPLPDQCSFLENVHRMGGKPGGSMTLAILVKHWTLKWARVDQLAKTELEERQALARDFGLTDSFMGRIATVGPESGADLPMIIEALLSRLT